MEPRSLYEFFGHVTTKHADRAAFRCKRDGRWIDVSWAEHGRQVADLSRSLIAVGVNKGDRVSILSQTRLEWLQCDSAIVNCGGATVGIYHSNLGPDCAYVLDHSDSEVLFVEDEAQYQKVLAVRSDLPELRTIVRFEGPSDEASGVLSWQDFLERGRDVSDDVLRERGESLGPDDLCSLVYTSGTTGLPKGAMITHGNLLFTAESAKKCLFLEPHFCTLLFLPLAHVFARMIAYLCQFRALTVAFAEDITKVADNIREIRPHFIISVPRIYEKIHEKITTTADAGSPVKRKLFHWAVDTGHRVAELRQARRPVPLLLRIQHSLANKLVLSKIQAALGGRVAWCASGAAPLNTTIGEFFRAVGMPIIEGLGMTENTSLTNVNPLDDNRLGTVGPAIEGVEMKLAEDGEVLFRGPNVMAGYFKSPEATQEAIDADGWLHTGDIGEIEDGYLRITDRKKDLIITAGGKNVAPQRIEKTLRESRYISQVVAYGDRRKYITALVTLDPDNIVSWARKQGLDETDPEKLAGHPDVEKLIAAEIEAHNRGLASFESVKQFRLLPRDLSIEDGDLTPTLKVKRKVVYDKYREVLESMYAD